MTGPGRTTVAGSRQVLRFWLGTHLPVWLEQTTVPLFVSHRRLADRRRLPRAAGPWALDSGAFSEIAESGRFTTTPVEYAHAVDRYATEIGRLEWAAIQDWMCEPFMVAKTGLSVHEHQRRTVASYLDLRSLAPHLPWVPVLQGYALADYLHCIDLYTTAGIDLTVVPLVGLGSVCRRQATAEIGALVAALADRRLRLHGFGVKTAGLHRYGHALASADSMAWSLAARRRPPLPGCGHKNCANCLRYALAWRADLGARVAGWEPRRAVTKPRHAQLPTTGVPSRTCPVCSAPLTTPATGRRPRYCQPACRQAAYRTRNNQEAS